MIMMADAVAACPAQETDPAQSQLLYEKRHDTGVNYNNRSKLLMNVRYVCIQANCLKRSSREEVSLYYKGLRGMIYPAKRTNP